MRSTLPILLCAGLAIFWAGCSVRSISDSGYRGSYGWGGGSLYRGELTEMDLLGAVPAEDATEGKIAEALRSARVPQPKRGDKVLLLQSGAMVPDEALLAAMTPSIQVIPFSGLQPSGKEGLAGSLRLRAAQGGCAYVVCVWGVLESAHLRREGTAVSWVPIVGAFIPDQRQRMRIRLKALILDVGTGSWRMLHPEPHEESALNSAFMRETSDQTMVDRLKGLAYRRLAAELVRE